MKRGFFIVDKTVCFTQAARHSCRIFQEKSHWLEVGRYALKSVSVKMSRTCEGCEAMPNGA